MTTALFAQGDERDERASVDLSDRQRAQGEEAQGDEHSVAQAHGGAAQDSQAD